MKFEQFQVVRVKSFLVEVDKATNGFDLRSPCIGDIATIVEVYVEPPGYELECSDGAGITQWLAAFAPNEIELELVQ